MVKRSKLILEFSRTRDSEPDTKAEVDLDDIAGTDKSQQVTPPQQQQQQQSAQPAQQQEKPVPPNLDKKPNENPEEIEKDDQILSTLTSHPYVQSFNGSDKSPLNPINIVAMDKHGLVELKAKIDEISTLLELKKKIGLYKDHKYQLLLSLKSFIDEVLEHK